MVDSIDTLIAFVIVIIGLSILVQVIVEALKNFLNLRWSVYEKFIKGYLVDTEMEGVKQQRFLYRVIRFLPDTKKRQKLSSVTERFKGFYNKLEFYTKELENIKVKLQLLRVQLRDKKVDPIAEYIPLLHEARGLIYDLGSINIRHFLGTAVELMPEAASGSLKKQYEEIVNKIEQSIKLLLGNSISELEKILEELIQAIDTLEGSIRKYRNKLSHIFEEGLKELAVRYTRYIAMWTFVVGLIMVSVLNADSIRIYRVLKEDPLLRGSIVEHSKEITERFTVPVFSEKLNSLNTKAEKLKSLFASQRFKSDELKDFVNKATLAQEEVQKYVALFNKSLSRKITLPFDPTKEIQSLKVVISANKRDLKEISEAVDIIVVKLTENYSSLMLDLMKLKTQTLYEARLPLGWDRSDLYQISTFEGFIKKVIGLLITAIFISFGAPFWNDILKALFGIKDFFRRKET